MRGVMRVDQLVDFPLVFDARDHCQGPPLVRPLLARVGISLAISLGISPR